MKLPQKVTPSPKPMESCSMLIVSTTLQGLNEKKASVLWAEATAHNVVFHAG